MMIKQLMEHAIDGLRFEMTCGGFPEQYDVFRGDKQIGYLRYRHGNFTVESPDCGGELLYEEKIREDGIFTEEERYRCLHLAASLINQWNASRTA